MVFLYQLINPYLKIWAALRGEYYWDEEHPTFLNVDLFENQNSAVNFLNQ